MDTAWGTSTLYLSAASARSYSVSVEKMDQYILLIHGNEKTGTTAEEWERFFEAARATGTFKGGSKIGKRELVGDTESTRASYHIVGLIPRISRKS